MTEHSHAKAIIERLKQSQAESWRSGQGVLVEDLLNEIRLSDEQVFELVEAEIRLRQNAQATLSLDEYDSRFPKFENRIRSLLSETDTASITDTAEIEHRIDETAIASSPRNGANSTFAETAHITSPTPGQPLPNQGSKDKDASDEKATSTFGNYDMLEKLGEGGMGVVWKARQRNAGGRLVALKLIRPDKLSRYHERDRAEMLARFQTEAQAAAQLDSDHITTVYEVGEFDDQPYYAMKYVEGESLADILKEGPLTNRKAAEFSRQVAEALAAAHQAGVLHRDLKPHNVMVDEKLDRALLTDFGLAKLVDDDSSLTMMDRTVVFGSPPYMSPEQAKHSGKVTTAADVYGLGATMYHLLVGRPPFQAASIQETLRQVEEREPIRPRQLNPEIDRDLETICLKCLEKKPENRYASAQLLDEELTRYLNREPILARPISRTARVWRLCQRNPIVASLIVSAALLLITVAATASYGYVQTQSALQREQVARQRAERLSKENHRIAAEKSALADDKTRLAEETATLAEEQSRLAVQNANLATEEKREAEKALKLSEFLIGTFKASDPLGLGGADFFVPKANADTLTAREILDRGAQRVHSDQSFQENPLVKAAIMDAIGDTYRQLGEFTAAEPLLTEALAIRREYLSAKDPDVAASCHNLAWYFHERGDFLRAEPLYREALAIRENMPGREGQRLAAATLMNLAWMLAWTGESERAEDLFQRTIEIRTEIHGEDHRDVMFSKLGLALTYIDQRKTAAAMPIFLSAQAGLSKLSENELLVDGITKFATGVAYRDLFGAKASADKLTGALDSVTKGLGADNIYAGVIHAELGLSLEKAGDKKAAGEHYAASLEISREKVQLQHPRVGILVDRYADWLTDAGRSKEARELWEEFVAAQTKRFGPDNQFTIKSRSDQTSFLMDLGEYRQAAVELADIVEHTRDNPTIKSYVLADSYNKLGRCQWRLGGMTETAEGNLRRAISIETANRSKKKARIASLNYYQADLGVLLVDAKQYSEAIELLQTALKIPAETPAVQRNDLTNFSLDHLAEAYLGSKEPQLAGEASLKRYSSAGNNASMLYDIAGELGLAAELCQEHLDSEDREKVQERFRKASLAILTKAKASGYRNLSAIARNPRFMIHRDDPKFKTLIGANEK